MPAARTRTEWHGFAIFALLVAIFVVRVFVDAPGLSLVFLAAFPIVLAAFALDRAAAIACALLATVLSVLVQIISPAADVSTGAQIVGGVFRGVVFVGLAVLVSSLIDAATALRHRLAESEREVQELESLRAALTAPELPAVNGLTIATSYTPADGLVAGDFFLVAPGARRTALVVVGDVVGHGLAAARRASFVRTTIALFAEYTNDPMTILRLANTALAEREPGHRVRDRAVRDLRRRPIHGDVGQRRSPAPVGRRPRRAAAPRRSLPTAGHRARLGGRRDDRAPHAGQRRAALHRRLPEARTARQMAHHQLFGEQATRETLRALRGASPEKLVAGLRAAAVEHAEGTPADDLCLVAVRFDGASAAQPQAA